MANSIKTEMVLKKETANKVVYQTTDSSSPIETQYFKKEGFKDGNYPDKLTLEATW